MTKNNDKGLSARKTTKKQSKKPKRTPQTKTIKDLGTKKVGIVRKAFPWLSIVTLSAIIVSFHVPFWAGELAISFVPQIMYVAAGLLMMYATLVMWDILRYGAGHYFKSIDRHVQYAFIVIGIMSLYVLLYSTHRVSPLSESKNESDITVVTYNAFVGNTTFEEDVIRLVQESPDVLALQEVSDPQIEYIKKQLGYLYSYHTDCGCSAAETDVAVVSKFPITFSETIYESSNGAILKSEIVLNSLKNRAISFYAVHIDVPVRDYHYRRRDISLKALTQAVKNDPLPVFIAGDFNMTVFSPHMSSMLSEIDSQVVGNYERRWPRCSWYGFGDVLCARIDHIFSPVEYAQLGVHTLQTNGSDHKAVIARFGLQ